MNQLNDTWQPLPTDVAEWMGLADLDAARSRSEVVEPSGSRGWRTRLRDRLAS